MKFVINVTGIHMIQYAVMKFEIIVSIANDNINVDMNFVVSSFIVPH